MEKTDKKDSKQTLETPATEEKVKTQKREITEKNKSAKKMKKDTPSAEEMKGTQKLKLHIKRKLIPDIYIKLNASVKHEIFTCALFCRLCDAYDLPIQKK